MLALFFWTILVLALYSYLLYPLLLKIVVTARQQPQFLSIAPSQASISLIITAFNEAQRIRSKIENTLMLQTGENKLEIIVASDCSDDDTDNIVREYESRGVILVRAEQRLGKEHAQLCAIKRATGDILVFSDVATSIPEDAISTLRLYFSDPTIGSVSSEDKFISQDGTLVGEGAYVKYEMWLRRQESKLAGLVGLSGSFFAIRRELCEDWDIHSPSDFNSALNTVKAGKRSISAPDVIGIYQDLKNPQQEYARKVRTVIRGMTGLSRHAEIMNPFVYGWFGVQVISHKLFRWMTPWFLIMLFIVNAMLANESLTYFLMFLGHLGFYGCAFIAHILPQLKRFSLIRIIYFFVMANIALFEASVRFLSGERMSIWRPSAR